MFTDDQQTINNALIGIMTMMEDIEENLQRMASDGDMMTKKYEQFMKLHKALMKAHKVALKAKSYEIYGEDYHED